MDDLAHSLYDDDFYAWTQEQADLLRRGGAGANGLDIEHIAEEIEDLGKSELHACQSLCEHIIENLLKLEYSGAHRAGSSLAGRDYRMAASARKEADPRPPGKARSRGTVS